MNDFQEIIAEIEELLNEKKYHETYLKCISEIRRNPHLAQVWVLLGQALLFMNAGKMAEMVFNRAVLLDPKAAWAKDIPEIISRVPKGKELAEVMNLFNTDKPQVTAAVLCKNESRCIERCLSSITPAVDEILVIDTGSTDNTLEIVKTFPKARIVHFEWCDDFSAARNFGLKHINTEWVIWIDADEYLNPEDISAVKEVAGLFQQFSQPSAIGIVKQDIIGDKILDDYGEYRMFKITHNFKFWGKIHERAGGAENCDDPAIYRTYVRIRFFHDGYNKNQLFDKNKIERNLRLLEKAVEDNPKDARPLYFYARELIASNNSQKASEILKIAETLHLQQQDKKSIFSIYLLQIKAYINIEDYTSAENICIKILDAFPNFPDALYYLAYMQLQKSRQFLKLAENFILELKNTSKDYHGKLPPNSDIINYQADSLLSEIRSDFSKYTDSL